MNERVLSMNNIKDIKVRIGYACINLALDKKYRTFRLKTIQDNDINKIKEVIHHNIILYGDIIHYNIKNNIYVYRLTSDVIPFASHIDMQKILDKYEILQSPKIINELDRIKKLQAKYNLRLSMHPSQFTVLTSPKREVIKNSIEEIKWQTNFMKQVGGKNIIIHVGGAYGDKNTALKRFKETLEEYKDEIDLSFLTVENDDKTYTSQEVVELCKGLGLKWVYDFHHERCNPSEGIDIIRLLKSYPPDKYHLSSGINGVYKPPHADYIDRKDYEALLEQVNNAQIKEIDVMFEAKQKNLAITNIVQPIGNGYWVLK